MSERGGNTLVYLVGDEANNILLLVVRGGRQEVQHRESEI